MNPQESPSHLILPTVHLNGTSHECLEEGYRHAYTATLAAIEALGKVEFNARDYYVQGDQAFPKARVQRGDTARKLAEVKDYLEQHLEHLAEQRPTRQADTLHGVPIAKPLKDEQDATAWLSTLAQSPLSFHLDDNLSTVVWTDIPTPSAQQLAMLGERRNEAFRILGVEKAWNIYNPVAEGEIIEEESLAPNPQSSHSELAIIPEDDAFLERLSLKSYKSYDRLSEETEAYAATLCLDGTPIAELSNTGKGSEDKVEPIYKFADERRPMLNQFQAFANRWLTTTTRGREVWASYLAKNTDLHGQLASNLQRDSGFDFLTSHLKSLAIADREVTRLIVKMRTHAIFLASTNGQPAEIFSMQLPDAMRSSPRCLPTAILQSIERRHPGACVLNNLPDEDARRKLLHAAQAAQDAALTSEQDSQSARSSNARRR